MTDPQEIKDRMDSYQRVMDTHMLMISGTTLDIVLSNPNLMNKFFDVAQHAKSVCVCRCSPLQKAAVAK